MVPTMGKLITFQLEAELVEPLIETLKSRAQAWKETSKILRDQRPKDTGTPSAAAAEALRRSGLYDALIEKISRQLSDS
jgi:hypothetical protein